VIGLQGGEFGLQGFELRTDAVLLGGVLGEVGGNLAGVRGLEGGV
jgi:hypothetical protein